MTIKWEDIIPGAARRTHTTVLTAEQIKRFAIATGESNPLYLDEQYARSSRYGALIAPPSIHTYLLFACTPQDDWMRTSGTINAGQAWTYNIPARAGDTIALAAKALDRFIRKQRLFVIHDNVFTNQHGEVICAGQGWTIRPI